jgi:N-acetylmuramoyl-L-alanine amidase
MSPPVKTGSRFSGLIVKLDAGHGGMDSGATNGSILEKNLNLDSLFTAKYLLNASGVPVVCSRTTDVYPAWFNRTSTKGANVFVALHHDTASAVSAGVYFSDRPGSLELARIVAEKLKLATGRPTWLKSHTASRFGKLYVQDFAGGKSILVEFGPTREYSRDERMKLVSAVVAGILEDHQNSSDA